MRQYAAAVLAVPILLSVYLITFIHRPLVRVSAVLAVLALGGVVWIGSLATPRTAANPPAVAAPVPVAAFSEVNVRHPLRAPVLLSFSAPMDEASVRAALRIDPSWPVVATFDAAGTQLTVAPVDHWSPDTYFSVTVGRSARDRSGGQLGAAVTTAFLTRPSGSAQIVATGAQAGAVALDTKFLVTVAGDVDPVALAAAVHVTPEVAGRVSVSGTDDAPARGTSPVWQAIFTPTSPLAPGRAYTVTVGALLDRDGATLEPTPALVVRTAAAPSVVRFRPRAGATAVPLSVVISVRFSQAMDRPSTQAAFSATVAGKAVAGSFDWAEKGTVLVFKPKKAFDYAQAVSLSVSTDARSARGVPLGAAASGSFTTGARPAPKPAPKPARRAVPIPSGGTVASGTWSAVEAYYLRLLNCTRTGGWVTSSGSCLAGSNGTAPLTMSAGLQTRVARPYAKVLATTGACSHTADGTFAYRLARGGFSGYIWAGENVGCSNLSPYRAVLADHLFFQNEKSTNGGHYRNIMDPRFKVVGVGVWVYGGRCRLVTDFLDP